MNSVRSHSSTPTTSISLQSPPTTAPIQSLSMGRLDENLHDSPSNRHLLRREMDDSDVDDDSSAGEPMDVDREQGFIETDVTAEHSVANDAILRQSHSDLVRAFHLWHSRTPETVAKRFSRDQFFLPVDNVIREEVCWGRRPREIGDWKGSVNIAPGRMYVERLIFGSEEDKHVYGVQIGRIEDFDCDDAILFFGDNGKLYYTPAEHINTCIVDGCSTVTVYGGYAMEDLATGIELDPWKE